MKLSFNTYHFVLMVAAASAIVTSAVTVDDLNLGEACGFAILGSSGITNSPTSAITGNIGVSPIDSTAMTGFGLALDSSGQFSLAADVTGKCYAADYGAPISVTLTTAVLNTLTTYTTANNIVPDYAQNLAFNGLAPGTIGTNGGTPVIMYPGKYRYTVVLTIVDDITLDAQDDPNAVFVIQTSGGIDLAVGKEIKLANGAREDNIYWTSAGVVSPQANSIFRGNILSVSVTFGQSATLYGRALATTAVTLLGNNIIKPDTCGEDAADVDDESLFC
jgi:hypothetical protein